MNKLMIACVWMLAACSAAGAKTPTNDLAERRQQMIAWLEEYEEAGVYPTDENGMPKSVFRDAHGVRCPMAELIHRSGRADLVDAVVAENNQLRLADVHDGALADWMASSGLTRDEIVMVQGAANIEYDFLQFKEAPGQNTIVVQAHGRMRGRLETATVALRAAEKAKPEKASVAPSRK